MLLAGLFADDRALGEQRTELEDEHREQLSEIRALANVDTVDIDRAASRRYYAGRLVAEMGLLEQRSQTLQEQIALCRRVLSEADRDVKTLEKLEEKQQAEFEYEQNRRAARELDDCWLSAHAMEYSR